MRKMWKKAAIIAMAGTMMMTGCALEGGIDLGHKKPAETLSTSKVANFSDASQASSAIPNTSVKVEAETPKAEEPTVTESAAPESTAPESTAPEATAESSTAVNITSNPAQSSTQESTSTTAWYQVTGEVAEGDGDVTWFTIDDITADHFYVTLHGSVNDEEISNITISVWTEANGQDDIERINAESIGNETKAYPIYISNHNNETSGYILTASYINKAGEEKTYQHYMLISVEE